MIGTWHLAHFPIQSRRNCVYMHSPKLLHLSLGVSHIQGILVHNAFHEGCGKNMALEVCMWLLSIGCCQIIMGLWPQFGDVFLLKKPMKETNLRHFGGHHKSQVSPLNQSLMAFYALFWFAKLWAYPKTNEQIPIHNHIWYLVSLA